MPWYEKILSLIILTGVLSFLNQSLWFLLLKSGLVYYGYNFQFCYSDIIYFFFRSLIDLWFLFVIVVLRDFAVQLDKVLWKNKKLNGNVIFEFTSFGIRNIWLTYYNIVGTNYLSLLLFTLNYYLLDPMGHNDQPE